jgi:hypothetical protein
MPVSMLNLQSFPQTPAEYSSGTVTPLPSSDKSKDQSSSRLASALRTIFGTGRRHDGNADLKKASEPDHEDQQSSPPLTSEDTPDTNSSQTTETLSQATNS